MASERKPKQSNSIPISFFDGDDVSPRREGEADSEGSVIELVEDDDLTSTPAAESEVITGGPALAELVATRAELKRVQTELAEALDGIARRQADFENYRKRIERERNEAHARVVADVARKLLPVVDNLARALDAERLVEATETKEFRHFLHGVELISKQLNDVLESLGVQAIPAVGERFDPHIHEAVVTEPTDKYEADTVMQELARGYRLGDKLVRPAMVKVAAKLGDNDD